MKKSFVFILAVLVGFFMLSCGSKKEDSSGCKTNSDCPFGQECSSDGVCTPKNSAENDSENGGISQLPDSDNSSESSDSDASETTDSDSQPENDTEQSASDNDSNNSQSDEDSGETGETNDSDSSSEEDGEEDEPIINDIDEIEIPTDMDLEFCDKTCPTLITDDGCLKNPDGSPKDVDEKAEGLCNGMDDDCDGKIDEGCTCKAGETQPCFRGKPAERNVGTCKDGIQNCKISPMRADISGTWGECKNDILPSFDKCDKADNNCNGCADEGLCCSPKIDCSYIIEPALPFTDKLIDGTKIYDPEHEYQDADKATWEWTLTKGSCDIILQKTSFSLASAIEGVAGAIADAADKITFSGVGLSKFNVNFQLSGTYNLHLKITRENGEVYECEWPLKVASNGLRVELCWDKTGAHNSGGYDLDLHLGKNDVTKPETINDGCDDIYFPWGANSACFYYTCKTANYNNTNAKYPWNVQGWGYNETNSTTPNPRLDIDNIEEVGKPENINLDNPKENDTFRVLVHLYPWSDYSSDASGTNPVVNIYCGGSLKATYGVSPQYTLKNNNDSWKVVEIKWMGDPSSDKCELTPNLNVVSGSVPDYSNW